MTPPKPSEARGRRRRIPEGKLDLQASSSMQGENKVSPFLMPMSPKQDQSVSPVKIPRGWSNVPVSHTDCTIRTRVPSSPSSLLSSMGPPKPAQHFKGGLNPVGLSSPALSLRPEAGVGGGKPGGWKLAPRAPVFFHTGFRATVV